MKTLFSMCPCNKFVRILSNHTLKRCASDLTLYYPLEGVQHLHALVLIKLSGQLVLWQTNNKNSGNMKKWWQIRELEGRKEEFGTNQLHDSLKMNPTITGKLKKYESLEAR